MIFAARSVLLVVVLVTSLHLNAFPSYQSILLMPGVAEISAAAARHTADGKAGQKGKVPPATARGDKRRTLIQYLKQLFGSAN